MYTAPRFLLASIPSLQNKNLNRSKTPEPKMALKIQHISTLFSNSPVTLFTHKLNTRISCSTGGGNGISDAALASELAAKVTRMNAHVLQTEEAMRKSRKLLFRELCEYLGLKEDEAKHKWSKMGEDEKWVLVKGFLADWGAHFHPLSARSTKEMVEEYLRQGNPPPKSPPSLLFPGLKRIIGFP
ncbi:hypothetical protein SESBI_05242 [Sesbania bispinosa]|nr:hypothetical protein SESBI_05242 [Sesbania bispinosa]